MKSIDSFLINAAIAVLVAIGVTCALDAVSGCATAKHVAGAAVGAFIDCTAPDIRARVDQLEPTIRPILVDLAQQEKPDTAPLRALTRNLDKPVRDCAVPTIGAAILAALRGTPATHAQQIDPARIAAIVREVADAELGGAYFKTAAGPI